MQILEWGFRPIPFLDRCHARFGSPFTVRFPGYPPIVMFSDPPAIREIFAGDPGQLHSGSPNRLLLPLLGRNSVILLDGTTHRRRRKLLMPPFHGERMRAYGNIIREVADASIDGWPLGRVFPLLPRMQRITLDVILRAVFGVEDPQRMQRLRAALLRLLGFTANAGTLLMVTRAGGIRLERLQQRLGRCSPMGQFLRRREPADVLIRGEIARRREAGAVGTDILSLLLQARDEHGRGLDDEELRDELMTLLVAGHETTATALGWAVCRALVTPEVHERLRGEADDAYLDAVVKESLRLDPVLPFVVRLLRSPASFAGVELPAGVVAAPNILITHRRADLWDDPARFDPRRFLDGSPRGDRFFPFGGGARTCIGMAFAGYEMRVVLERIFTRTELALPSGYRPRPVRRAIVLAPSRGAPVVVARRR